MQIYLKSLAAYLRKSSLFAFPSCKYFPCFPETKEYFKRFLTAFSVSQEVAQDHVAHDERQAVDDAIAPVIEWRHSEMCFPLAAAI